MAAIEARLGEAWIEEDLDLPFTAGKAHAWLHAQGVIRSELQGEDGWQLRLRWTEAQKSKFAAL